MNDFLPPKRTLKPAPQPQSNPLRRPLNPPAPPQFAIKSPPVAPPALTASKRRSWRKMLLWVVLVSILLVGVAAVSAIMWYKTQLQPLSSDANVKINVEIIAGSSPAQIGVLLEEKKIIRSQLAFDIYTRLSKNQSKLQAGIYSLPPAESTEQIVAHLIAGKTDEFKITFLPGATLADNRTVLLKAGYSEKEVDDALNKTYNHPLFRDKPASTDLEGYIFGETYHFDTSTTVEEILIRTFDQYYSAIEVNNLIEGFKTHGLNLYEGITLASIIQREVPGATDQKQVAQVFFTRLAVGMTLGSDVTYQYAAKKMGVSPTPSLESPYNTRKYSGLPPGPIAVPGVSALQAVAEPAEGDFVYFLSGDDNKTYFARTNEEHEVNIRDHCQLKCLVP